MAGNPKKRMKKKLQNPNFGTRWCDRPEFVGMKKDTKDPLTVPPIYVFATPDGYYTIKEEVYCWRLAYHGKIRLACREAYGRDCRRAGQRGPNQKLAARIAVLKEQDAKGEIRLADGPWKQYGWPEEFPDYRYMPKAKDLYSDL